jgi:peptidoglycan/LPS O-acetylase OafA/YrhL
MLGHLGPFPLVQGLSKSGLAGLVVRGVYNNLFVGPPAVIVFFVISGYCIHRPFRDVARLPLANYFSRRYVRILFPMLFAVILAKPVGFPLPLFNNSILWSLLAELIYYSIYPVLRPLATRLGWRSLIAIAYVASLLVATTKPAGPDYAAYGIYLNWLLGLPCWLLGCLLAGKHLSDGERESGVMEIWSWRMGVWGLSTACSILNFHSPVVYPRTLNLFAFVVFFWLGKEISFHRHRGTSKVLAWAGLWTYSLYLTHRVVMAGWHQLPLSQLSPRVTWLVEVAVMLLGAYLFYRIVERPGHILARRLAQALDSRVIIKQARV